MNGLNLKIPPLILLGGFMVAAYCVKWLTAPIDHYGQEYIAIGLMLVGSAVCFSAVWQFRKARTTVDPRHPEMSQCLVVRGVYRYTRNPMYLGFLCVLMGFIVYLGVIWNTALLVLFVTYLNRFQIQPEEHMMARRFGPEYREYCSKVRRWL